MINTDDHLTPNLKLALEKFRVSTPLVCSFYTAEKVDALLEPSGVVKMLHALDQGTTVIHNAVMQFGFFPGAMYYTVHSPQAEHLENILHVMLSSCTRQDIGYRFSKAFVKRLENHLTAAERLDSLSWYWTRAWNVDHQVYHQLLVCRPTPRGVHDPRKDQVVSELPADMYLYDHFGHA